MNLKIGRKILSHNKLQYNYSKKRFIQRAITIRIIGVPDNQRPDEWSLTVQNVIKVTLRKDDIEEM